MMELGLVRFQGLSPNGHEGACITQYGKSQAARIQFQMFHSLFIYMQSAALHNDHRNTVVDERLVSNVR